MPLKGYKQTEEHKNKINAAAKLRAWAIEHNKNQWGEKNHAYNPNLTEEDRVRLRKEAKRLSQQPQQVEKEIIIGETTAKPEEILAIWNDTNAGEKYPDCSDCPSPPPMPC